MVYANQCPSLSYSDKRLLAWRTMTVASIHTTTSNGCLDQWIQLFITSDGQLQVTWRNALYFQILRCISCQLQHLENINKILSNFWRYKLNNFQLFVKCYGEYVKTVQHWEMFHFLEGLEWKKKKKPNTRHSISSNSTLYMSQWIICFQIFSSLISKLHLCTNYFAFSH